VRGSISKHGSGDWPGVSPCVTVAALELLECLIIAACALEVMPGLPVQELIHFSRSQHSVYGKARQQRFNCKPENLFNPLN
jgi:hypothetical protein